MRSDFADLTGMKFGKLTVLQYHGKNKHNQPMWDCRCECGNKKVIRGMGKIYAQSCGCLQREAASLIGKGAMFKHGDASAKLYRVWAAMKSRCQNPKTAAYKDYGGRGIRVCAEWDDYESFKEWALQTGYDGQLTLERKNVNGNYAPDNCKWISIADQQSNRRNNIRVEVNGELITLAELSRRTGILDKTLYSRYKRGCRSFKELTAGLTAV
ncbi:hypothetical protein [Cohnella algarum]|uniref:hypothetical protein n=1 Tax=Cohnella algarum TaxID=2044859 RepID=UPI001967C97A|nr:hypothetical protein [Cohnella algarum]MBN2980114.1 hypothetical protein [Cohnella algarum]